ncbi:YijD family membrane protein [Erwinia psidii]|uniref:YijD family membrane protein n=1 Tax=Erwinia psidii TaxID=69224 RepID=A0A3N6SB40_9GAMM|nr:YijD family membrane protein [Erwinia psidii]MCX8959213.1 YijD family membrane protein [Erwinia psidii]MCX8962121.1 YijD family membrane protein [Erwinia psidii]MCX8966700.1 YijD family membrane protein [Erwinia psidii]RQM37153.1 YijD family membrane protein [Erwinia psidii]
MNLATGRDRGTLLLAFLTGLSINGTFSVFFSTLVPFSVFPMIALGLSAWCLHQRYLNRSMPEGMPSVAAAFFLLGILLYSAIVRAEYPDLGSNFIPTILMVALVFWIGLKLRSRKGE